MYNASMRNDEELPGLDEFGVISDRTRLANPDLDFSKFKDSFMWLVGNFTTKKNVLIMFRCDPASMEAIGKTAADGVNKINKMCRQEFGMSFDSAFDYFHAIADSQVREAFKSLSMDGASTATGIVAKYFMDLKDEEEKHEATVKVVMNVSKED